MGLSLQKHGALLGASVSSGAYRLVATQCIWVLVGFCSCCKLEPSSQAENLGKLGAELKGAVLSSAQRGGAGRARESESSAITAQRENTGSSFQSKSI